MFIKTKTLCYGSSFSQKIVFHYLQNYAWFSEDLKEDIRKKIYNKIKIKIKLNTTYYFYLVL